MYGDTLEPFKKHVSNNKSLKRIIFKFDNKIVDEDWETLLDLGLNGNAKDFVDV